MIWHLGTLHGGLLTEACVVKHYPVINDTGYIPKDTVTSCSTSSLYHRLNSLTKVDCLVSNSSRQMCCTMHAAILLAAPTSIEYGTFSSDYLHHRWCFTDCRPQ
ncbi:hypothetical protein TNIN_96521 [Trichonephila inaurata madagascariensis]|uniref:Uncharacterized protein n=1 Tax=Trichonephila inaurata madagascariensis TaxID=2747483 RepID=A0A8X6XYH4_9ARAC|nr:hypothetical protein TNIN_96521 [Trichonephila inaurata madagascariensis]